MRGTLPRVWGLSLWIALAVGLGIAPGLRGARVGLEGTIRHVDLAAAISAQWAALLTSLLLVHFSMVLLRRIRPLSFTLLGVLPVAAPAVLLLAAQRFELPPQFLLVGAFSTAFLAFALGTLTARIVPERTTAKLLFTLALTSRAVAAFLVRERPSSLWLPVCEIVGFASASALVLLACRACLASGPRFRALDAALLGVALLLSLTLRGATYGGASWSVVVIGRSLDELVSLPPGVPRGLGAFVISLALVVSLRGFATPRGEAAAVLALLALATMLPLGPLALASLALGALLLAAPRDDHDEADFDAAPARSFFRSPA